MIKILEVNPREHFGEKAMDLFFLIGEASNSETLYFAANLFGPSARNTQHHNNKNDARYCNLLIVNL